MTTQNQSLDALFSHRTVQVLAQRWRESPYSLYLVGGAVRDAVAGRPSFDDLDFTTDAEPDEIERLVRGFGEVWLAGKRFGTIGVSVLGQKVEVTTFRGERYNEDSRKPEVVFTRDINEDLERRDFTVNSLAMRVDLGGPAFLIDPFGGERDIEDKVLRTNLPPDVVLSEDPLRAVRAVRFYATKGYKLSVTLQDSIRRNASRLDIVAAERIMEEVRKINKEGAYGLSRAWWIASGVNIQKYIFGRLDVQRARVLDTLEILGADAPTSWASILIDSPDFDPDDSRELLRDLKLSNDEMNEIERIAMLACDMVEVHSTLNARILRRAHKDIDFDRAWNVAYVLWGMPAEARDWLLDARRDDRLNRPLPVDGFDVMDVRDIEPSGKVGFVLRQVELEFTANPDMTRAQALDFIKAAPLERRSITA